MAEKENIKDESKYTESESALSPPLWGGLGGADYYFENGFMVFTEAYHLKRGHCCKNACRHCPYGFRKKL